MSIYIVSEYIDKELNSTGFYWEKIAIHLGKNSDKVYAISPGIENQQRETAYFERLQFKTLFKREKGGVQRFFFQIEISIKFILILLKKSKNNDIVFMGTNPQLLIFFMPLVKAFKNIRLCVLCHDLFPENVAASGFLSANSIFLRAAIKISNRMYNKVDKIIVIGRDMLEMLNFKTLNQQNSRIRYIPNFLPSTSSGSVKNHISEDKEELSFQYFGNFGRVHGIPTLLKCISKLEKKGYKSKFIFSGGGYYQDKILDYSTFCNISLKKPISFQHSSDGYKNNAISLVTLDSQMYGLAVPSKAYSCMANGRKFVYLGPPNSELHRLLIENKKLGWFANINDESECFELFKKIIEEKPSSHHSEYSYLEKILGENVILDKITSHLLDSRTN